MLARARFRDDASLAHPLRQQRLRQCAVDLVRAGVIQILALEIHVAPNRLGQSRRGAERRWTPDVFLEQAVQLALELRVPDRLVECGIQLVERGDQRLWHVLPAERAETVMGFRRHG